MNGFEGILCGLILALIVIHAWRQRAPGILYLFAVFAAFAGLADYTRKVSDGGAPYIWGAVAFFIIAGLFLQHEK